MNTDSSSDILVVLDRPQDAVNIGAVVRAVKNMGFTQLRLVNPRPFDAQELARVAHHADDVIAAIRVFATLDAALADAVYVVGTSAIAHTVRPVRRDIEPLSRELLQKARRGPVALLFGTEDDGLDNAALDRCHVVAALPTNPAYPALNLAQSVLLFLYELSRQASAGEQQSTTELTRPAVSTPIVAQVQLEQMFALGEQALAAIGFFKYNPQAVIRTLRQLAYRAELQPQEAALLMAIARQTLYVTEHPAAGPKGAGGAQKEKPAS
jgi:tRNA/rRNA methyltransferase